MIIVAVLTVLTLSAPHVRGDIRPPTCGDRSYHVRVWNHTDEPVVVEVDLFRHGWASGTLVIPAGGHRMRRYPASVTTMELWSGRRLFLASATSMHLGLTCHSA